MSPSAFSQMFPPSPSFTEKQLGDVTGKVYIVTGASSGVGFELSSILYGNNATVYMAARSEGKLSTALESIKAAHPKSTGSLSTLIIDTADLTTVKPAAESFLAKEQRLDVLYNNAGVMMPPQGSTSKQGHDLEMSTNCLGPYLFYKLLSPLMTATAAKEKPGTVRVVWVASMLESGPPKGGIEFESSGKPKVLKDMMASYMQTKVGNTYIAGEKAKEVKDVVHVSVHPGIMRTELQRHNSPIPPFLIGAIFKGPKFGAYSELFAGCSPDVTIDKSGSYLVPWGRFADIPGHIAEGLKTTDEGGNGKAKMFTDWCEKETSTYA